VRVCVRARANACTMWKPQQPGGLGPIWAVTPQIRRQE